MIGAKLFWMDYHDEFLFDTQESRLKFIDVIRQCNPDVVFCHYSQDYHPDHQITSVDVNAKKLVFANGAEADFDVLAYVPPHRPPRVIGDSGLAGDTGWVAVDRHTLETRFAGVYAIGDVVSIPLKLGRPLPKAGVFAHAQAKVVAANIVAAIKNRADKKQFSGHGECFIEIGDGKAGFGGGDFYAEPKPVITIHPPSRRWHIAKVLFEKLWLFTKF